MKVTMQLFGSFSLTYGEAVLKEETIRSNKITKMLVYFLLNRDSILPRQRLIELLWEDDPDTKKPEGALKNMMYRVRMALKTLGDEDFIQTVQGGYRWNPEIEAESDVDRLEQLGRELEQESEQEPEHSGCPDNTGRKKICSTILGSYQNHITASVQNEPWMQSRTAACQSIILRAGNMLCEILEQEEDWKQLEIISKNVLLTDPLDPQAHGYLMNSLYGQQKYDCAAVQYEKSKKLMYENKRTIPTEKFQRIFQERMAEISVRPSDMTQLLEDVQDPEPPKGIYFCDYQVFRQLYRMEQRRMDRLGIAEHLLLLTLRQNRSTPDDGVSDNLMKEGMDLLETFIRRNFRTGDMAARYSYSQFIVLLYMCNYDAGVQAAERICQYFREIYRSSELELTYELAPVGFEP